ncbi:hypothetical protein Pelo_14913 [Pelomyxa schiedti]|nr:hypothetical protein Pelo_14913 [Pelomyxa schiedti]
MRLREEAEEIDSKRNALIRKQTYRKLRIEENKQIISGAEARISSLDKEIAMLKEMCEKNDTELEKQTKEHSEIKKTIEGLTHALEELSRNLTQEVFDDMELFVAEQLHKGAGLPNTKQPPIQGP